MRSAQFVEDKQMDINDKLLEIIPINPNSNNFIEVREKLIEFLRNLKTYEELGFACNAIGDLLII